MLITPEIMEQSSWYEIVLERGEARGMEQGVGAMLRLLRKFLAKRFPGEDFSPDLAGLHDLTTIGTLGTSLIDATDVSDAREAIKRAADSRVNESAV